VSVDWNDGSVDSTFCPDVYDVRVVEFSNTYQTTGTYTVTGFATNILGEIQIENQTISVYERIHNLVLYGNSSMLTPPGTGLWGIFPGPYQRPLEDVVCVWNMGTEFGDTSYNVSVINSTTIHETTFSYGQVTYSREIISVTCNNPVSNQYITMEVNFFME